MKVVIFTETKIGEGHYQAAKAVAYELEQIIERPSVKIISGLSSINPLLEWLCIKLYFTILQLFPFMWRLIYCGIKKRSALQTLFFAWRLEKVLAEEKPDLVLCTHPACISALHYLKQNKKYSFSLAAICTDFSFHPFFVSKLVDYYFVPHSEVKQRLIDQFDIQAERIFAFGIPLRPIFEQVQQEEVITMSQLQHRKIRILVLGGAEGLGPLEKIIRVFKSYRDQFELIVITGKNTKLYTKLSTRNENYAVILGYVDNIADWFKQVDIILSKPGGLTISEAIASGTPCILLNPIPGHEEANRDFLVQQGLALFTEQLEALPETILALMESEQEWFSWQERIKQFHQQDAAKRIAQKLILG